jgi:hypothetical protein
LRSLLHQFTQNKFAISNSIIKVGDKVNNKFRLVLFFKTFFFFAPTKLLTNNFKHKNIF